MARNKTMTVRLSGVLSDFVAATVDENGSYENVSEYIRDLGIVTIHHEQMHQIDPFREEFRSLD